MELLSRDTAFLILNNLSVIPGVQLSRTCKSWYTWFVAYVEFIGKREIKIPTSTLGFTLILAEMRGDIGNGGYIPNGTDTWCFREASMKRMRPSKKVLGKNYPKFSPHLLEKIANSTKTRTWYALTDVSSVYDAESHLEKVQTMHGNRKKTRKLRHILADTRRKSLDPRLSELLHANKGFVPKPIWDFLFGDVIATSPWHVDNFRHNGAYHLVDSFVTSALYRGLKLNHSHGDDYRIRLAWFRKFVEHYLDTPSDVYEPMSLEELIEQLRDPITTEANNWIDQCRKLLQSVIERYAEWDEPKVFLRQLDNDVTVMDVAKHKNHVLEPTMACLVDEICRFRGEPHVLGMLGKPGGYYVNLDKVEELARLGIFRDPSLVEKSLRHVSYKLKRDPMVWGAFLSRVDLETFPIGYDQQFLLHIRETADMCSLWEGLACIWKLASDLQMSQNHAKVVNAVKNAKKRKRE